MEQETKRKENKMGYMPIRKLLISMSLPMMISMLVQAMYNIVDSIFVAQVGQDGLSAVSLAFPIQMLMIAVGAGTGVGINALLSKSLGEGKYDKANKTAMNGIFLTILSFIVFAIIGIFFSERFFVAQIDDKKIIEYGIQYLSICTIGSIGILMQMTMERLLQSTGNTFYTMITQGIGAIINIILDPILIFGLFGMPKMGVAGAAFATVFAQIIAALLAIYFNIKRNKEIKLSIKGFRPDRKIINGIYSVGVPAIIMQAIGSVTIFGMNQILTGFTSTAVAVLGVYFKLQSFVFMPIFGLNNGMIPILAYNYGARQKERIIETIKLSLFISISIMILGKLVFQFLPVQLLQLFNASKEMLEIGVPALQTISWSFIFAGFCIIVLSVFQAFGEGILSLIVSATRQLIVILPVAYFLSKQFGLLSVWWAFPIAEIVAVILSVLFLKHIYNKKIKVI